MNKHFKLFIKFFLPPLLSVLLQLFSPALATASSDCISSVQIPSTWKTKFPFDLVYPVSNFGSSLSNECPTVNLWGVDRQMCAPMTLASVAKNAFLLKVVIQSLFSL